VIFNRNCLTNKTVFVTGGGTGIGRAVAIACAGHGASVVVAARRKEPLEETVSIIVEAGGTAESMVLDIRDAEGVESVVGACWDTHGGIDVLVNNAGANFLCPAAQITANGWRTIVDINLNGTFLMSKAVGSRMIAANRSGSIINMSATNAENGSPLIAHSGASKAGINSLTETLAVEWGPCGIRVNAILPGPVRTEGSNERLWTDDALVDRLQARIPMARFATPEDIAPMAIFLASDASAFVTGALIPLDGGDRLRTPFLYT
jgi:NAD(P)-dependent dehydrogenase (short-subunit alcohol dehydrogenase family)